MGSAVSNIHKDSAIRAGKKGNETDSSLRVLFNPKLQVVTAYLVAMGKWEPLHVLEQEMSVRIYFVLLEPAGAACPDPKQP